MIHHTSHEVQDHLPRETFWNIYIVDFEIASPGIFSTSSFMVTSINLTYEQFMQRVQICGTTKEILIPKFRHLFRCVQHNIITFGNPLIRIELGEDFEVNF